MAILEDLAQSVQSIIGSLKWDVPSAFSLFAVTYTLYCLITVVYRLYFSLLAKSPGPRLAAITDWYEVYYDIFANGGEGGQFARHIEKLHQKYGPIHPAAEQHQERRADLNPFFSKQRIRGLHERLTEIVERVSSCFANEYAGTGKIVNFNDVWSNMTMDTVTALAFSRPTYCSAAANFESPLAKGVQALTWGAHWNAHFKIINDIMGLIPVPIMLRLMPGVKPIVEFRNVS